MKLRNGFVSNSSSSSFILQKKDLTPLQIYLIYHHLEIGRILEMDCSENEYNRWSMMGITNENSPVIYFETPMNNFDMVEFLKKIGVTADVIPPDAEEEYG